MKKDKNFEREYNELVLASPTVKQMGVGYRNLFLSLLFGVNDKYLETVYKTLLEEAKEMNRINAEFKKNTTEIMDRFEVQMTKIKQEQGRMKAIRSGKRRVVKQDLK